MRLLTFAAASNLSLFSPQSRSTAPALRVLMHAKVFHGHLEPHLGYHGPHLGVVSPLLGHLGPHLWLSGSHLKPSCSHIIYIYMEHLEQLVSDFQNLEGLGASWGHLKSILGPSWEHLGSILEHLGTSWADLGSILGPLGRSDAGKAR